MDRPRPFSFPIYTHPLQQNNQNSRNLIYPIIFSEYLKSAGYLHTQGKGFMKLLSNWIGAGLFVALTSITVAAIAQNGDCAALVEAAIAAAQEACQDAAAGEVCYGNAGVSAESRLDAADFVFGTAGDIVSAADLETLTSTAFDAEAERWGVTTIRISAGLPEGQFVTMLIFGEVAVQNAVAPVDGESVTLELTALQSANVRAYPSTEGRVVGSLTNGQVVTSDARLADQSWLRIALEDGTVGWIFKDLVSGDAGADVLAVADPDEPLYSAMQAFTFSSGRDDAPCDGAPESGILLQTPGDARRVTVNVNNVEIELGSTVYLQAAAGEDLLIDVLEGQASVTADELTVYVPAGAGVNVPLDDDLNAADSLGTVSAYEDEEFGNLPLELLNEVIEVADPFVPPPPPAEPPPPTNPPSGVAPPPPPPDQQTGPQPVPTVEPPPPPPPPPQGTEEP